MQSRHLGILAEVHDKQQADSHLLGKLFESVQEGPDFLRLVRVNLADVRGHRVHHNQSGFRMVAKKVLHLVKVRVESDFPLLFTVSGSLNEMNLADVSSGGFESRNGRRAMIVLACEN